MTRFRSSWVLPTRFSPISVLVLNVTLKWTMLSVSLSSEQGNDRKTSGRKERGEGGRRGEREEGEGRGRKKRGEGGRRGERGEARKEREDKEGRWER
jgi:hypothetical protein